MPVLLSIVTKTHDFQKNRSRSALYGKPKMIFRLWIGLRSRLMRIQLKMCGSSSLRGNFVENVYSL